MAPDLPYFIMAKPSNDGWFASLLSGISSHGFTQILTIGLPLALVLAGFMAFVDRPMRWALPESWIPVQRAFAGRPPSRAHLVLWTFHSLLIGLLTHLVWDSFTHSTGWVVLQFPVLSIEPLAGIPVYRILQHCSSLAGLALLALWYRKQPRTSYACGMDSMDQSRKARTMLLVLVCVVPAAAAAFLGLGATPAVEDAASAELFLQIMILRGGTALLGALAVYGLAWHAVALHRRLHNPVTTHV
ncbi:hypothetical protein J2T21_002587 [Paeniglutamicibacter psychrophenolicus]|nr:hypothetical protein [Paeniglutamicibacter psychrophenolicus]